MGLKALDISNWQPVPSQQQLDCWYSLGYCRVIVGCSYGTIGRVQCEAVANDGRFELEVYGWLRHPIQYSLFQKVLDTIVGLPVKRIYIDWEDADDATGKTPEQLEWDVKAAIEFLQARTQVPLALYTGDWFYEPYVGTGNNFGLPLWIASYTTEPIIPACWKDNTILWQTAGSIQVCGMTVDDDLILIENGTDRMYTDAQIDEKVGALFANAMQNGADILAHGAAINFLCNAVVALANRGAITPEVQAELEAQIADIKARQTALEARVKAAAGAILDG
jgi:hypothetical protein